MIRLGLRLALGSRDAVIRLLAIAVGVMVGTALLLFSFSGLNVLGGGSERVCWRCTTTNNRQPSVDESKSDPLLWRYTLDYYKGNMINRYDVATKGPHAPVIPGIDHMPAAGEYYVSPALAKLLDEAPADQLDNRFPDKLVGQIGNVGLDSADALIAIVGNDPDVLAEAKHTIEVRSLEGLAFPKDISPFIQLMFAIGAAGLLFAIMTLINAATRLSAARREEKFAALRLFGATPRQVNQLAAIDATLGALVGALAGIGIFFLLRPVLIWLVSDFVAFFPEDLTPGLPGVLVVLIGTPIAAAVAALLSLRKVRISPLGVARRTAPKPPRARRIIPLLAGLLVIGLMWYANHNVTDTLDRGRLLPYFFIGFVCILIGIVSAGPWLTMVITRLLAKRARSAPVLMALRRLADNPTTAFRPVSVLVIAAFLCGMLAMFAPLVTRNMTNSQPDRSDRVITQFIDEELHVNPMEATAVINKLETVPSVHVLPAYTVPASLDKAGDGPQVLVACDDIRESGLGIRCPSNAPVVMLSDAFGFSYDMQALKPKPVAIAPRELQKHQLRSFVINFDGTQPTKDRLRTVMAHVPIFGGSSFITMGEFLEQERKNVESVRFIVSAALLIILFVAGCSLAIMIGGSLIERKRPFGLLRVAGMSFRQLARVILIESVVPLVIAAIMASLLGVIVAYIAIKAFAAPREAIAWPEADFYAVVLIGLCTAIIVITATLPLLKVMTRPEDARFE
jgi:predicted lysophospholipase L1 biosynthesis ABC-type transport system permease subunit